MKKNVLVLLALFSVMIYSCTKSIPVPVDYSVNDGNPIGNVYIPDSGTYTMSVLVKFLSGNTDDKVNLSISGLPAHVTVTPDTFSAKPTYTASFVFNTNHAAIGSYPVTLTSYTPTTGYKTYSFNVVVIEANCATGMLGTYTGSNACSATNYNYTAVATGGGSTLVINNLGGYGTNTNTVVVLNCNNDSLSIASQNIGNGVTMQGSGIFSDNKMVIHYTATNVPSGGNDACTATLTK